MSIFSREVKVKDHDGSSSLEPTSSLLPCSITAFEALCVLDISLTVPGGDVDSILGLCLYGLDFYWGESEKGGELILYTGLLLTGGIR